MRRGFLTLSGLMAAGLVMVIVGCGDDSDDNGGGPGSPNPPPPVALEDAPAELAKTLCNIFSGCVPEEISSTMFVDDCAVVEAAVFENGLVEAVQAAVTGGSIVYHADKMPACLSTLSALGCAGIAHNGEELFVELTKVAECAAAIEGQVALSDPCTFDAECADTAYCDTTGAVCPGACATRLGDGATCLLEAQCELGLVCDGTCTTPAALGEACGGNTQMECAGLLDCAGEDGQTPGQCATVTSGLTAGVGDDCNLAGGPYCQGDLSCTYDKVGPDVVATCESGVASGAACKFGMPDPCPDGEYCSGTSFLTGRFDGTCAALPVLNEACNTQMLASAMGIDCAAGLVCDATKTCVEREDNGGTCAGDSVCFSQNCVGGQCETSVCIP